MRLYKLPIEHGMKEISMSPNSQAISESCLQSS